MIPLRVKIQTLRPPDVMRNYFNSWVREGLMLAGKWWIENRLKEHFGPRASQLYHYAKRTAKHLIAKSRKFADMKNLASQIGQLMRKSGYEGPGNLLFDPHPYEFTGGARRGAESGAKATATATTNNSHLEITVPVGYASIYEKHRGGITRVLAWENQQMRRMVIEHVRKRRTEFRQMREVRIAA